MHRSPPGYIPPPGRLRVLPTYQPMTRPLVTDPVLSSGEPVPSHLTPNPPSVTYDGDRQRHTRDIPEHARWWKS